MNTQAKNPTYTTYISLGAFYLLIKIVFFFFSEVIGLRAILHGIAPTVLTIFSGFLAINALNRGQRSSWQHWMMIVLPVLIIILTPLIMLAEKGSLWLEAERLPVLILFEALAFLQLVLAIRMFNKREIR